MLILMILMLILMLILLLMLILMTMLTMLKMTTVLPLTTLATDSASYVCKRKIGVRHHFYCQTFRTTTYP